MPYQPTTSTLDTVKDVVLIAIPIATFFLALFTIDKWKKEYKAKVYFDCSFKFLKSAYTLRDQFMSMRSPLTYAGEMLPRAAENEDNYERENLIYCLNNRYKPFQEALNNFYSVFPEVEVLLGKEVIKVCWDINLVVSKYNDAVNEYIQLVGVTNNFEHLASISQKVYNNTTPNKLKDEIDAAILKIETAVSKHLNLKV